MLDVIIILQCDFYLASCPKREISRHVNVENNVNSYRIYSYQSSSLLDRVKLTKEK